jgi:hypothetical protein
MPDIRYVCLSDMHLGADNSVLTNLGAADRRVDPSEPSPSLVRLVECLRELIFAQRTCCAAHSNSER